MIRVATESARFVRPRDGDVFVLPSGSRVVVLEALEGDAGCCCQYLAPSKAFGEVMLTTRWLQRFARREAGHSSNHPAGGTSAGTQG